MPKFQPIEMKVDEGVERHWMRDFLFKSGHSLELLAVLVVWLYIFSNQAVLGGFTRKEMITYLIAGGIFSVFTRYLVGRHLVHDIYDKRSELLIYRPFLYLARMIRHNFGINYFSFLGALLMQLLLLYIFIDYFTINFNYLDLIVIGVMLLLALIIEFLLAFLAKLYIMATFDSEGLLKFVFRMKNILAGNYFPLSFLPVMFVNLSLALPFAYSFFIPAEIYLDKISLKTGLLGLGVQAIWIIILYGIIRLAWRRRVKQGISEG